MPVAGSGIESTTEASTTFEDNLGVDFGATDFPAVARALGGNGIAVRDRPALAAALEDGLAATEGFTLIAAEIGTQTYDGRF